MTEQLNGTDNQKVYRVLLYSEVSWLFQKFLAFLNVRLVLPQVCGPDDIIHLKHKNIYWALSTYLSLDAKFVYLAIVMVENQGVRNSSFLLGLISPNYVRQ